MPGYTHFQHAQPWTFGHYLMRQVSILERDLQRLRQCYERTNLSALGGAAQAGTSWPLDRRRCAELLGHSGIVLNSNDAGEFARDHLEELIAVLAVLMSNLGRLATDLYVWSSWEFSLVEIDDGLAGTSSIMPQKKNPHALERVKALSGQAAGWMAGVMGCQRGVLSTDLDMVYGDDLCTRAAGACRDALALMSETVRTLRVHEARMRERADVNWSTTSHLADELVRRLDLPFRDAHAVVGDFVRRSLQAGHRVGEASAELLDEAARRLIGRPVDIGSSELRRLLDARTFVESRVTEGSVHPDRVGEQIAFFEPVLRNHLRWLEIEQRRVLDAIRGLEARARELASA